jgi:hypothetical protein
MRRWGGSARAGQASAEVKGNVCVGKEPAVLGALDIPCRPSFTVEPRLQSQRPPLLRDFSANCALPRTLSRYSELSSRGLREGLIGPTLRLECSGPVHTRDRQVVSHVVPAAHCNFIGKQTLETSDSSGNTCARLTREHARHRSWTQRLSPIWR